MGARSRIIVLARVPVALQRPVAQASHATGTQSIPASETTRNGSLWECFGACDAPAVRRPCAAMRRHAPAMRRSCAGAFFEARGQRQPCAAMRRPCAGHAPGPVSSPVVSASHAPAMRRPCAGQAPARRRPFAGFGGLPGGRVLLGGPPRVILLAIVWPRVRAAPWCAGTHVHCHAGAHAGRQAHSQARRHAQTQARRHAGTQARRLAARQVGRHAGIQARKHAGAHALGTRARRQPSTQAQATGARRHVGAQARRPEARVFDTRTASQVPRDCRWT